MNSEDTIQILTRPLQELSLTASAAQCSALARYAELVLEWNPKVNITGAKDVQTFVAGPLFDALTLLRVLEPCHRFVDIGSGGGLPAIPLCIFHPEIDVTMVEPRGKRVQFLQMALTTLQLNATVLHTQDRELSIPEFDGASAQAVFPPKKWLLRGKKLVRAGGAIYALSSEPVTDIMCPGGVSLETQQIFHRNETARYAARLRKTT